MPCINHGQPFSFARLLDHSSQVPLLFKISSTSSRAAASAANRFGNEVRRQFYFEHGVSDRDR